MTYLIAQIWAFIAVAAAIGLLFGWMFRGGVSGARLRELKRSLAHAEAEAVEQRREAAEMAARAERRAPGATSADVAHMQIELRGARERMSRLEAEAREASNTADRYAEEAEELRQRIADLTSRGGGVGADERVAWRARVTELEQEADSLRRRLEARDADGGEAASVRIAELETEREALRERVALLETRGGGDEAAGDRIGELEREAETLRRQLAQRADAPEWAGEERLQELEAESESLRGRIASLEADLHAARSHGPNGATDELASLRAEADRLREELAGREERLGLLQADLDVIRRRAEEPEAVSPVGGGARGAVAVANGIEEVQTESARLKWRNSYLTSRIHFLESRLTGQDRRRDDGDGEDSTGALAAANAEVARLTARIADLEKAAMPDKSGQPAPNVEQGGGSLEWRNRYLASRVRYLEQQIKQQGGAPGAPAAGEEELRMKLAQAEEKAKEAAKLRARISELEHVAERGDAAEDSAVKTEVLRALEWRVRYLSSRVKYLEDRLTKSEPKAEAEPTEA